MLLEQKRSIVEMMARLLEVLSGQQSYTESNWMAAMVLMQLELVQIVRFEARRPIPYLVKR